MNIILIIVGSLIGTFLGLSLGWWIGELQSKKKNRNHKIRSIWSVLFKN